MNPGASASGSSPALAALLLACALQACTTQQIYDSAQQWQRNECRKLPVSEQERCLQSHAMSFEQYQAERAAAQPK